MGQSTSSSFSLKELAGTMGVGMMMGPATMRSWRQSDQRIYCNPGTAGFTEWQYERIVRAVRPNDVQVKALDGLRAASTKAAAIIAQTCPAVFPTDGAARLVFMEKRMESMLEAIRTVRPAFEAFYGSLDSGQKSQLDAVDAGRGWRRWQ